MQEITISLTTIIWVFSSIAVVIGGIEAIRTFRAKRGLNFKMRLEEHDKDIENIKASVKKMESKMAIIDSIATGIQSILRSQMVDTYNIYHKKGSIPMWVKNSFDDCFRNYKLLGGNGFMDNIHTVVMEMSLTEDKNGTKSGRTTKSTKQSAGQGKTK